MNLVLAILVQCSLLPSLFLGWRIFPTCYCPIAGNPKFLRFYITPFSEKSAANLAIYRCQYKRSPFSSIQSLVKVRPRFEHCPPNLEDMIWQTVVLNIEGLSYALYLVFRHRLCAIHRHMFYFVCQPTLPQRFSIAQ